MKDAVESVLQLPSLDSKRCGESIIALLDGECGVDDFVGNVWEHDTFFSVCSNERSYKILGDNRPLAPPMTLTPR